MNRGGRIRRQRRKEPPGKAGAFQRVGRCCAWLMTAEHHRAEPRAGAMWARGQDVVAMGLGGVPGILLRMWLLITLEMLAQRRGFPVLGGSGESACTS